MNSDGVLSNRYHPYENILLFTRGAQSANLTHSIVSQWREIIQQLMLIMIRLNHLYHSLLLLHGKFYCGFGILRTSPNHLLIYVGDFF